MRIQLRAHANIDAALAAGRDLLAARCGGTRPSRARPPARTARAPTPAASRHAHAGGGSEDQGGQVHRRRSPGTRSSDYTDRRRPGRQGRVRPPRHRGRRRHRCRLRRGQAEERRRDDAGQEAEHHPLAAGRSRYGGRGLPSGARGRRRRSASSTTRRRVSSRARTTSTIVSDDLFQMGEKAADAMAAAIGGKGKVGYLFHDANFYVTNQRDQAFKETIEAKYPDIEIVAEQGLADPTAAEDIINAFMIKNPDLDAVYVTWAEPAEFVLAALRNSGNTHDQDRDARPLRAAGARHGEGRQRRGDRRRRGLRHRHRRSPAPPPPACSKKELPPFLAVDAIAVTKDNRQGRLVPVAPPRPAGFADRRRSDGGEAVGDLRAVDPSRYVVYVGFFLILVGFSIVLRDDGFLTTRNLLNIVQQTAPVTVMAVGMVFVLTAGEIDLSIGSIVAISALLAAMVLRDEALVPRRRHRACRRRGDRRDQRRARRLSAAAVLPGDARHHGPARRRGALADQPPVGADHQYDVQQPVRRRQAVRRAVAACSGRSPSSPSAISSIARPASARMSMRSATTPRSARAVGIRVDARPLRGDGAVAASWRRSPACSMPAGCTAPAIRSARPTSSP